MFGGGLKLGELNDYLTGSNQDCIAPLLQAKDGGGKATLGLGGIGFGDFGDLGGRCPASVMTVPTTTSCMTAGGGSSGGDH